MSTLHAFQTINQTYIGGYLSTMIKFPLPFHSTLPHQSIFLILFLAISAYNLFEDPFLDFITQPSMHSIRSLNHTRMMVDQMCRGWMVFWALLFAIQSLLDCVGFYELQEPTYQQNQQCLLIYSNIFQFHKYIPKSHQLPPLLIPLPQKQHHIQINITINKNNTKMNIQESHQQDITQRDDIIIFSEALSKSSHNIKNIKNYRKLHHDLLARNDGIFNSTQCTNTHANNNDVGYVCTIDNSERLAEHDSQERMRINLESLPVRRNSVTAGNSRRRKNIESFKTQARTLNLNNNISFRQNPADSFKIINPKQNKFASIQKKFNKGPMKDKYLACWLNSLLLQACQSQKFDSTIQNPALKKYGLDENSLRSKGIRPENLTRIYKSLFVYSIGFNDLLKQICGKNMNLRKTIWKVFAVLLEYCAQGQFETMIVQIERDRLQKVENLSKKLREKQQLIENIDELNEKKNVKIYKENDELKQRNKELINEKAVLLQQFKQAEQAFNQEVSLRLKYENKINQIHGVYSDIQNKHNRLLHDHQILINEVQKLRSLTSQQTKTLIDYKKDNEVKFKQIEALKKDLKFKIELIGEMQTKKHGDAHTNIQHSNIIKDLKLVIQQKNRQISQVNISMNSLNLMFQTEKQEHQKTSNSLSSALQQNGRLHATILEQMRDLNVLLMEKRNFGMETSNIQAQIVLINSKVQQKTRQLAQMQKRLQKEQQQVKKLRVEVQSQKKLKIQFESDLKLCYTNIKQMKMSKNLIEQENGELKRKMQSIDDILAQKDEQIKQRNESIQNLTVQYIHPLVFEDVCSNYQNKATNSKQLQQKLNKTNDLLTKTIKQKQESIRLMKQKQDDEMMEMRKKYQQIIQRKENQILYEGNKYGHLLDKYKGVQADLHKYTGGGKEMSHERQQKYLNDIKSKKQQIQMLSKQLDRAHNANQNLKQNYLHIDQVIQNKDKQLDSTKQQIQQIKQKYQKIIQQKTSQLEQHKVQLSKLKQQQMKRQKQRQRQRDGEDAENKVNRSKEYNRSGSGKKGETSAEKRAMMRKVKGTGEESERNDIAKKIKGAYIYYAK